MISLIAIVLVLYAVSINNFWHAFAAVALAVVALLGAKFVGYDD